MAATLAWTGYALLLRKWPSPLGAAAQLAVISLAAALVNLPFALWEIAHSPLPALSGAGLTLAAYLLPAAIGDASLAGLPPKPLRGQSVHLLGLGFRPGVKVDTFSQAYALRSELLECGALATLSDPCYSDAELTALGFSPGVPQAAKVVVLNTAHSEFASPDFAAWKAAGVEVVLDGRNFWSQAAAEQAGLIYLGIGRAAKQASAP